MLRAAFWLTALVFLPAGLFLYFLPPGAASLLGVSPLWLARVAGGLVLTWGVFLLAASLRPDSRSVFALAAGNLLTVAALVPPALRLPEMFPGVLRSLMLGLSFVLVLLAVVGMVAEPVRRSRL